MVEIKTGNGLFSFISKLLRAKDTNLTVGFFDEKNATKAYQNEYGSEHAGISHNIKIPARPFMQMTVDRHEDEWAVKMGKLAKKYSYNIPVVMQYMGEVVKDDMFNTMITGNFVSNAESTIKAKGKNTPLFDTSEMSQSITYKVE